jgi:hypothetical protein
MALNVLYNLLFYTEDVVELRREWKLVYFNDYNIEFKYKLPYVIPSDEIGVVIRNLIDKLPRLPTIITNITIITEYLLTIYFTDNSNLTIDYRNYMFDPVYIYDEPVMEYSTKLDFLVLYRLVENKLNSDGNDFFVEV